MDITLRPEFEALVEEKVRAGKFGTADDVVSFALTLLREQQDDPDPAAIAELRREVDIGLAELERGEAEEWDAEEIKAEGRRLLAAERQRKATADGTRHSLPAGEA